VIWTINFSEVALKQLKKLDKQTAQRIVDYLTKRVSLTENPKLLGKALLFSKIGLWRYRIGDYRVICKINDAAITILVLELGHRKNIYD
jgi:mRNA interferase RelE/StbE